MATVAVNEKNDTILSLAKIIGLPAKKAVKWLKYVAPDQKPAIDTIGIEDPLPRGEEFRIPNTVLAIYSGGDSWKSVGATILSGIFASFDDSMEHLRNAGFYTDIVEVKATWDNIDPTKADILQRIGQLSESGALFGLWYHGHGTSDSNGMVLRWANIYWGGCDRIDLPWSRISDELKYTLGLVVANCCYGNGSDVLVTKAGGAIHKTFDGSVLGCSLWSASQIYDRPIQGTH